MAKKKKKQNKTKEINSQPSHLPRWLTVAVFVFLGILIFYPPFFRGLFFNEDMFIYHIFTALVFLLIWGQKLYQKDYTLLKTPLDWAILAYAGAYLLSLIGAVHPGEAFYGFLRVLNYFMVFWMVTQVVKNFRDYKTILQVLLAAGTGVAVVGLLAATGYSDYPSAFDGRIILSTLQYPNAAAAYLAVISLLAITLVTVEKKLSIRLIYTTAAFIMILVILCTLSKGAWLIFIIGAILLLAVMPGSNKISSLWTLLVAAAAAGATYIKFYPAIIAKQPALAYLLIGVLVVAVGMLVWEGLVYVHNQKGYKATLAIAAILVIAGMGAAGMVLNHQNDHFEVGAILQELAGLTDFSNASYTSRADFTRWGLDIVKDYPVNGAGAGGWNALYHSYQDYLVFTTEAHNHFIQVWVEAGTIGLLAFLAIWILFFRAAYQTYRQARNNGSTDQQILIGGTFIAAVALGLHAAIDFDLSLSAIALVLWTLWALISAAQSINHQYEPAFSKFAHIMPAFSTGIAILCFLVLIFCGCSYYGAHKHAVIASQALHSVSEDKSDQEKNELFQTALEHYERAAQLNSLNAEYQADLAYCYALTYFSLKESGNQLADQFYQQAVSAVEKATELKPYNTKIRNSLLNTTNMLGDLSQVLQQAEGAMLSSPLDVNGYETLIKLLAAGLEYYQQEGDDEQAALIASKMLDVHLNLEKRRAQINNNRPWNGPPLILSHEAQYNIAKADYLLGNYQKCLAVFKSFTTNLLNLEFPDTGFSNTSLENENWVLSTVRDKQAVDGTCLKAVAKQDQNGWPIVLDLASRVPVQPGAEYILEVRYRINNLTAGSIADTSNAVGIWSTMSGERESKNVSFAFHRGAVDKPQTSWNIAQQKLRVDEGYQWRRFRIGTGSVGASSTFFIDYVKFYPVLNENTPQSVLEQYAWYAASLYKTGATIEADYIAEQLKTLNPQVYSAYEKLINQEPFK